MVFLFLGAKAVTLELCPRVCVWVWVCITSAGAAKNMKLSFIINFFQVLWEFTWFLNLPKSSIL